MSHSMKYVAELVSYQSMEEVDVIVEVEKDLQKPCKFQRKKWRKKNNIKVNFFQLISALMEEFVTG